jgi:ABC-type sugar transport system substrate-binding protein
MLRVIQQRTTLALVLGSVTATALLVLAATAAGGSAAPSVGGYIYAGTAAQTKAAAAAGAKAAGAKVAAPTGKTIAVIELSATSSESIGVVAAANQIAKLFHYKVITCDPNFDPQKVVQCATSMIAQHPSVIFSVSTNTGAMGSGFSQAVAAGIPWFDVVSAAVPAKGLYNYGTDGFKLAKILDQYMFQQMKAANPGKSLKLFGIDAPTVGLASADESKQVAIDAKAAGIALTLHNLDLSNAVQDAIKSSQQALQQNPGLAGMWTYCDFCLPLMAQQAQTAGSKAVVAGQYANPAAITGIKKGTINAVSDLPWQASVWVAIDQVLQNWTRKTAIAQGSTVYQQYALDFFAPYLITKANVGSGAGIPVFGPDYQTFFMTKWSKEFGV